MDTLYLLVRRCWVELLLSSALILLCLQLILLARPTVPFVASLSLRNADFPNTFIGSIYVDLTSPHHWVRLDWSGPESDVQETGPFHSSPGRGVAENNCDDVGESNRMGSNCTPKGEWIVEGHSDYLPTAPSCTYGTWFQTSREIALHSHSNIPDFPASHGCVRLSQHAAQLIHNNSIVGQTRVIVGGTWTPPPTSPSDDLIANRLAIVDSDMILADALEGLPPACPQRIRERQKLLDVVYYSFDGRLHRGQIVIDRELADDIQYVFRITLSQRFPIESVIPVAHSRFRQDGRWDDQLSMRANNTSAFNYRDTTSGQMLSDHALGRAIDINPVQNPYINGDNVLPRNASYDPSAPGTLTRESVVVQAFLDLGWQWGGQWRHQKDYQHFAKPSSVPPMDYDVDAKVHRQQANRLDGD